MIAVRPTVEPRHRVEEMLGALDHRWPTWFLSDVHESFDAQKPRSEVLRNSVKQKLRFLAREGAIACDNEILDSPPFKMRAVRVAAVIVIVMVAIVRVMVVWGVLVRLNIEPRAGIRLGVRRVETPR
jgi:anti-sigma-K factor RskA